jgi:pullulanase
MEEWMKKQLLFLGFMSLILMVSACSPQPPTIALNPAVDPSSNNTILVVHYNRFDEEYDPWNLWLWPNEPVGLEGSAYRFTEETDYGVMMRLDLSTTNMADSTRVGIIVRTDSWDKDVAEDGTIQ